MEEPPSLEKALPRMAELFLGTENELSRINIHQVILILTFILSRSNCVNDDTLS